MVVDRRDFVRCVGAVAAGTTLAGCASSGADSGADDGNESGEAEPAVTEVEVGPEKRLRFEPEVVEISVGDTVRWIVRSEGHNVTSHPDASPKCENPEGAEPFKSYEGESHFAILEVGATFEHQFTVPGEYVYVCTPHAGQGMVGTVMVAE